MEQKRMMRSRQDRMIAGVCGGVADYFEVDPALVRLIFVLVALVDGIGLLVYLVLWLVMPEAPVEQSAAPASTASGPTDEVATLEAPAETEAEQQVVPPSGEEEASEDE